VVGLKPTYGRVSRYGLLALASSLDQIGPITKNVYDSALMLNILSGQDPENNSDLSCITRSKKIKVIYTGKFPIKSFLPNPTPLCLRMLYAVVT